MIAFFLRLAYQMQFLSSTKTSRLVLLSFKVKAMVIETLESSITNQDPNGLVIQSNPYKLE
jgi:hypothetical protein